MKRKTIERAIYEAQRFIERVGELVREETQYEKDFGSGANFPKESGAVRRASMDLTRALADLRQGR